MDTGLAFERFASLMALPDSDVPLWEVSTLIAAHARPDLELNRVDDQLASIGASIDRGEHRSEHRDEHGEAATGLAAVARAIVAAGFRGNSADYGAPANSYLDVVLDRRLGIPITLSVVTIDVGRRCGVPIEGIGLPSHFVVRDAADPDTYFDPFHGALLDADTFLAHVARLLPEASPAGIPVQPYGTRAIASRMLRNLEAGPAATDYASGAWFVRLHRQIPGLGPGERIALARRARSYGDFVTSAEELALAAADLPDAQAGKLLDAARADRARAN